MRITRYVFLRAAVLVGILGFQHHCGTAPALRAAEADVPKPISGTVTDFKVNSLEIGVKSDGGEALFFKVGAQTEVVQVPPGEHDLSKAKSARLTDLARGDRILVSFVSGLTEARRIVWISATDIAARNEAERVDWQKRGISGIVTSRDGNEVNIEIRSTLGVGKATLTVAPSTRIRRYAPDSVSFADAEPSTIDAISKGDQVRTRGNRSAEGKLIADDIVFGTFLSKLGTIASVDTAARTIRIQDLTTKQELTVKVTANSQLKMIPGMKDMSGVPKAGGSPDAHSGPPPGATFDIGKIIAQLPVCKIEDLKAGSTVIVTSTAGAKSDEITAILLMANAEALIQMARMESKSGEGVSATQAISSIHGGMLAGPGGLSIPTIIP